MAEERFVELVLSDRVKVLFTQLGRPIERYSVVLLGLVDGDWREMRVFDNHLGSHHMHRYTPHGGKQAAEVFHPGPTNAAIAAAIAHLKDHWMAIMLSWEQQR